VAGEPDFPTERDSLSPDWTAEASSPHVVVTEEGPARVFEVLDGAELVIGRGQDATIRVDSGRASRRHAIIRRAGNVLTLEDLGSRNGTIVSGTRVHGDRRPLLGGDVIVIGSATIVIASHTVRPPLPKRASRLDRALAQVAAGNGGHATLLWLESEKGRSPALEELKGAPFVEPQPDGACVVVVSAVTSAQLEALRRADPQARIETRRYPDDGASGEALLAPFAAKALAGDTGDVVVADPQMVEVFRLARRLAAVPSTVLITGETGTGKEVVASLIHRAGPRANGPFVSLNCASLPDSLLESELFGHAKGAFTGALQEKQGYFEAADKGTLFLDEIGELPAGTQVKLLTVLEQHTVRRVGDTVEKPLDVRVVCATHRDLQAEVKAGRFREDLYFRIAAFTLSLPALRDRPGEVQLLAQLFAQRAARSAHKPAVTFSPEAAAAIARYRWPGNIRELRNAIDHALVMSTAGQVRIEDLPKPVQDAFRGGTVAGTVAAEDLKERLDAVERRSIESALEAEGGNQTRAARRLGISRRALIYKLEKYGLKN
jgi:DNA-binding NtrC family response regulator/pSer/pThr/pTyr-binding forkhead associated (FHA) protein